MAGLVAGCLGDVGANSKRRIHSRKPTQGLPAACGVHGVQPLALLAAANAGTAAARTARRGAERVCLNESELVHLNLTAE